MKNQIANLFKVTIFSASLPKTELQVVAKDRPSAMDTVMKLYYPFPKSRDCVAVDAQFIKIFT